MGLFSNLPFLKRSQAEASAAPAAPAPEAPAAPTSEAAAEPVAETLVKAPVPAVVVAPAEPVISSETRAQAEAVVRRVVEELPDFMTVAIVDGASGRILAGQWAGHSGGAVEVAAANAAMVQQTRLAIEALQLGPEELLEDILITLQRQLHLLRVLPAQNWLLYLAVRTQDINPALARTVLRNIAA
ncbi:hypothetical protein [Hymenobacter bucti]|uniref:Roadblock/LC7 domain-containing protein n=1 Tax=Hymenobacter bucti TaxID=1844114 RepID=A0ABW4QW81_9BACT